MVLLCVWLVFARAFAPALMSAGALVLIIAVSVPPAAARLGLDRLMARSRAEISADTEARILWTSAASGIVILAATFRAGDIQDYGQFELMWAAVLRGEDPWNFPNVTREGLPGIARTNVYGPAFNVLSLLTLGSPLLPKLLFAAVWLLWSVSVARSIAIDRPGSKGAPILGLAACLLNPYFWVEIVFHGHFDILYSVLMLSAIGLTSAGPGITAGAVIGLGILLKYLPGLILPVQAVTDRRSAAIKPHGTRRWWRIRADVLTACLGTVALGFAAGYLVWGISVFQPLYVITRRPSALLSIFYYLEGPYSPLALDGRGKLYLSRSAKPLMILFGGLGLLRYVLGRAGVAVTCALVVLSVLMFYNAGFPQYEMMLVVLLYFVLINGKSGPGAQAAILLYLIFLAAFDVVYLALGWWIAANDSWHAFARVIGLPFFLIKLVLHVALSRIPVVGPERAGV
jgi:hypothetical protein